MEALLGIRDDVSVAKNLVACAYLACQSPTMPSSERAALCTVTNAAREKLEAIEDGLDVLIANASSRS